MYSTILSTVSGFILVWSSGPTVFKIVEDPLSTLFANRQTDCNSFLSYEGSTADVNELFAPFSNFFYCLSEHFCNLVRRENSDNKKSQTINATRDLYPHKYRLAKDEEPMSFSILWNNIIGGINYKIETYEIDPFSDAFGCKETIIITLANNETPKEVNSVYDQSGFILELRKKIQLDQDLNRIEKRLCELFFLDFDNIFSYHFQPTFLKQKDHQDILFFHF